MSRKTPSSTNIYFFVKKFKVEIHLLCLPIMIDPLILHMYVLVEIEIIVENCEEKKEFYEHNSGLSENYSIAK